MYDHNLVVLLTATKINCCYLFLPVQSVMSKSHGTNNPIAFLFNAAAMCKGPVLAATNAFAAFIKAINCCNDSLPVRSVIFLFFKRVIIRSSEKIVKI